MEKGDNCIKDEWEKVLFSGTIHYRGRFRSLGRWIERHDRRLNVFYIAYYVIAIVMGEWNLLPCL